MRGTLLYVSKYLVYENVILNFKQEVRFLLNRYLRTTLLAVEVSVDLATDRRLQKELDTWKVTWINLLCQESAKFMTLW